VRRPGPGDDARMIRATRSRGGAAALLLSLAVLGAAAGCSGSGGGTTTPSAPPSPTATAAPSTTAGAAPASACADVAAKGNDVASAVLQFVGGQVPASQVSSSIQELENSVTAAKASSNGVAAERLNAVQTAADQLKSALQAQPVDPATVRTAAQQTLAALKGLSTVCAGGASGTPSATTTG
jgi:hypothetical protein